MQLFIGTLALIVLALPHHLVLSQSDSSCYTNSGEQGLCVTPQKCQFVRDLLLTFGRDLPRSIQNEIRAQACYAGRGATFHMCCPSASVLEPQSNGPKETPTTKTKSPVTPRQTTQNLRYIDPQGLELLNSMRDCGKKSNIKLSHGEATKIGEFPWLVLLKYQTQPRPFLCGGSLITDRFVLTAAHCTRSRVDLIGVRLGEHNLSTEKDCQLLGGRRTECLPPYEEYGIDEIRAHPKSEQGSISYDIALIKLDRTVEFKIHIKPICLPIEQTSQDIAYDQSFYISGWGTTEQNEPSDVLLKALVKRQELDVCRNYYVEAPVTENHICAVSEGAQHTCRGDSGGPVFFLHPFKRTARYVQYGVISFGGRRCGINKNEPGVFASVLDMLPWITQNLH